MPVERFDDGTAPGQVDALVRYPDRLAALEVVADPDKPFQRQLDALYGKKNPIEVPGLRKSWIVSLSRQAKINNVKRALPALLLDLQDNPRPERSPWDVEPSELDRLGITSASPIDESTVSGYVWLVPVGWGGGSGDERTVGEWVTRVLVEKAPDLPGSLPPIVTWRSDMRSSGPSPAATWRCRCSLRRAMITLFRRRRRRCQQG